MSELPPEKWRSWTFMAETEADQPASDGYVRYHYLDRSSAELAIRSDIWENLGRPETIEVTVEPYDDDFSAKPS